MRGEDDSGFLATFIRLSEVPTPMQLPSGWKATLLTNLGREKV